MPDTVLSRPMVARGGQRLLAGGKDLPEVPGARVDGEPRRTLETERQMMQRVTGELMV
jgi:hypothetical protein